jgi:hypothetical protein
MFKKVKRLDLSQWVVTKFYHYPSVAGEEIGEYDEVWHDKPVGDPYIKEVFHHFMTVVDHYFHADGKKGTLYDNKVTIKIENIYTGEILYVSSKDGRYRLGTTYYSEMEYSTDFGIIHKN